MTWFEIKMGLYGFALGLLVASLVWVAAWWRRRAQRVELKRLREHLNTQMEITSEGANKLKEQLATLRTENENLRITVKTWQQKPDREELRMLQVYDRAVHQILADTPGFAPAWEAADQAADSEVAQADRGLIAFAKRLVLPAGSPDRDS